jgi:hypothetical protein
MTDLSLITATDLLALADEEVVPLAAEMARDMAHYDVDAKALIERLAAGYATIREVKVGNERDALVHLLAGALMVLSIAKRERRLYQTPDKTRPVKLPREDFLAFRVGRLRHVSFRLGTYHEPHEGDVLRLLETNDGVWTGRDALAEVLHVTLPTDGDNPLFVASVRPWRGVGTESAEEALRAERERYLQDALTSIEALYESKGTDTYRVRVAANAIRTLMTIFKRSVHPAIAAE